MVVLLVPHVFGLTIAYNKGGESTFPACNQDEYLIYDSGAWACTTITITGGTFNLTCDNGEITIYDTGSSEWICSPYPTITGGSFNLTCMDGQTTTYDTGSSEWVCADVVVDTQLTENEVITFVTNNGFVINTTLQNYYTISSINSLLANYYNISTVDSMFTNYYTISSINSLLANYYNISTIDSMFTNYYNTSNIDSMFTNYYTISSINSLLANYYNISTVDSIFTNYYNTTNIDSMLSNYYTKSTIDSSYLFNVTCGNAEILVFNSTSDSWECDTIASGGVGDVVYGTYWNNSGNDLEIKTVHFEFMNVTSLDSQVDDSIITAYFKLDETTGTNAFDSTGSYNGTASNSRIFTSNTGTSGKINSGADFTQGNDDITLHNNVHDTTVDGTVAYWFNSASLTGTQVHIGLLAQRDFRLYTDGSTYTWRQWTGSAGTSDVTFSGLSSSTWYHVCAVKDGNTARLYINGQLEDTNTIGAVGSSSSANALGYRAGVGSYYNGFMDEVMFSNVAFTSDECLNLYNSQVNGTTSGQFPDFIEGTAEVLYVGGIVSAEGYITRTPKDELYNSLETKRVQQLPSSHNARTKDGKLNKELLFDNERYNGEEGSYYVDALADNNRVLIIELYEKILSLEEQIHSLKNNKEGAKS